MKVLSIIPARSGSKGIPNKNIIKIKNKFLIDYTIDISINCPYIDFTFVSTDSIKIKKISEKRGLSIPFLRPKSLSTDKSNIIDTITYSLNKLEALHNIKYDIILILQPTSPLRIEMDVYKSLKLIKDKKFKYDSVISITKYNGISPNIMYLTKGKYINLIRKNTYFQRQQYEKVFFRNGLVYAIKRETILKKKSIFGKKIGFIETPFERSINLDTKTDLKILKKKIKNFD